MTFLDGLGIWIAAGLTLLIFSFVYKDNPAFKIAEHIYLGVSLGYGSVIIWHNNIVAQVTNPLLFNSNGPDWWVIPPLLLGLFIVLRVVPSLAWLSRMAFAVYIAGYAGLAVPNEIAGRFLPQIGGTVQALAADHNTFFYTLPVLIGVFCTVIFFFFSLEHKGTVGAISRVGIVFIMISFGASFGYTVMARVSLLIGRFQFLIEEFWGRAIMGGG